ncbi:hypothetical protein [Pseudomonas typographi]|uniref:hypothetical protein n=1 Tax=Pseudomonas typographi TaxID=2715964 RepID=UPI00168313B6|nr:hypothetical protein [Pseudomonas typographi]MBD1553584.1 hypothetical protein [Pseudomonas typographi]
MNNQIAQRLLALWAALQRRETTFAQVMAMAAECGIDGRQVLADHFLRQPDLSLAGLEA